ncbi:MAG: ferredoxin [Hyphomicrobiales bacterium]|jgi:ferredoxin|nr:ferredoxin [Hyphomicrobiales bacterium]
MSFINVIDRRGEHRALEAVEGWRLMEILRDYRVGIEGVCGGACDCATCHVVIDEAWAGKLVPPRDDELDKLDELPLIEKTSRLSCQIIWSDELDGLTLTLPQEF